MIRLFDIYLLFIWYPFNLLLKVSRLEMFLRENKKLVRITFLFSLHYSCVSPCIIKPLQILFHFDSTRVNRVFFYFYFVIVMRPTILSQVALLEQKILLPWLLFFFVCPLHTRLTEILTSALSNKKKKCFFRFLWNWITFSY